MPLIDGSSLPIYSGQVNWCSEFYTYNTTLLVMALPPAIHCSPSTRSKVELDSVRNGSCQQQWAGSCDSNHHHNWLHLCETWFIMASWDTHCL